MKIVCDYCGEEIKKKKYALPFDNIDNACHIGCVEDWFIEHIEDIICEETIYVEEE